MLDARRHEQSQLACAGGGPDHGEEGTHEMGSSCGGFAVNIHG
jgi:hypothetical protein